MDTTQDKILIWLPSPLGDVIMCTPALKALRQKFKEEKIYFLSNPAVRELLDNCQLNDDWIIAKKSTPITLIPKIARQKFKTVILFKNSFGSALVSFLSKIPRRIGYARDGRAFLLTDKIQPQKYPDGTFKPVPQIDYYLKLTESVGAETSDRKTFLPLNPVDMKSLSEKMTFISDKTKPVVILVPGGGFGPSKCWPAERFAHTADYLIDKYNANIVISVAPNETEHRISRQIRNFSTKRLYSLEQTTLTVSQLKALYNRADLIITNDTGPRHIAIALGRKLITLFGPNDPQRTESAYEDEVKIIGAGPCVPCDKPKCVRADHICMTSITSEKVCTEADKILGKSRK